MLVKGKFLEKTKYIIFFCIIFFSHNLIADEIEKKILKYNNGLKNSSALFIQSDGSSIETGEIYFGDDRIKINYLEPNNITLIFSEKKGMYANHDLEEAQYFNVNKSYIVFFFKVLNGENLLNKPIIKEGSVEIIDEFVLNDINYKINIIYENDPLKIRKVKIFENAKKTEMSFFNHNNLITYEKKFFSMINPYLN